MNKKLNFLIPVDFRPESEFALGYAQNIARKTGAVLHLLHVLEEESPLLRLVLKKEQREMILRGAKDQLDELGGKCITAPEIHFTTTVKQGKIYDRIIETAAASNADLIFMGRTDSSDIKKNFLGTNTMHIIREARIPVITLRKKPEYPSSEHIVLPLDLTKQTIRKASQAIAMARLLQAKVTVLSFLPVNSKGLEIKFIKRLDKIRNCFEKLEVHTEIKLVPFTRKEPHDVLNETVQEIEGDLVMVMTQQEMNITQYFIGSVAQDIINECDFPVLSFNPLSRELFGMPDPFKETFIDPIQILDR